MIIEFADRGNLRNILLNNLSYLIQLSFEEFGYKGKEIKAAFDEADKEIPNISILYERNSDAVYTSRAFNFTNLLTKPVNSSIITSYINEENDEVHDPQLVDLEISNIMQLEDTCDENNADDSID
uniref:Uncharacterized protein n=1 Tax=Rhizophagus irregularis (strain DAOM 181602 / DAOM 197198 / MUCL 43194) TaxID=747089 RepID=U9TXL1_RHIID